MKRLGLTTESEHRKRLLRIEKTLNRLKKLHEKNQIFLNPVEGDRLANDSYLDDADAYAALLPAAHALVVILSPLIEWRGRIVTDDNFSMLMTYAKAHVQLSKEIDDEVNAELRSCPIRSRHFDHHFHRRLPTFRATVEVLKTRAFVRGI